VVFMLVTFLLLWLQLKALHLEIKAEWTRKCQYIHFLVHLEIKAEWTRKWRYWPHWLPLLEKQMISKEVPEGLSLTFLWQN
jgi:hypothetical protein